MKLTAEHETLGHTVLRWVDSEIMPIFRNSRMASVSGGSYEVMLQMPTRHLEPDISPR